MSLVCDCDEAKTNCRHRSALLNSGASRVGATPVASLRFHIFEYEKTIDIAGIVRIRCTSCTSTSTLIVR